MWLYTEPQAVLTPFDDISRGGWAWDAGVEARFGPAGRCCRGDWLSSRGGQPTCDVGGRQVCEGQAVQPVRPGCWEWALQHHTVLRVCHRHCFVVPCHLSCPLVSHHCHASMLESGMAVDVRLASRSASTCQQQCWEAESGVGVEASVPSGCLWRRPAESGQSALPRYLGGCLLQVRL